MYVDRYQHPFSGAFSCSVTQVKIISTNRQNLIKKIQKWLWLFDFVVVAGLSFFIPGIAQTIVSSLFHHR